MGRGCIMNADKLARYDILRAATSARIGLGRVGDALPTRPLLDFQLAHARARDAVHTMLDMDIVSASLAHRDVVKLRSQASGRGDYLRRPDRGRRVDPGDLARLRRGKYGAAFVIADGLSALAVNCQAAALVTATCRLLDDWCIAPVVLVEQGRVAIGDEIGAALGAAIVVVLLGERPGLSAADSLGAYLTWNPMPGRRDSERNCISNIRPGGLSITAAADQLAWLLREARSRRLSGIGLKDERLLTPAQFVGIESPR